MKRLGYVIPTRPVCHANVECCHVPEYKMQRSLRLHTRTPTKPPSTYKATHPTKPRTHPTPSPNTRLLNQPRTSITTIRSTRAPFIPHHPTSKPQPSNYHQTHVMDDRSTSQISVSDPPPRSKCSTLQTSDSPPRTLHQTSVPPPHKPAVPFSSLAPSTRLRRYHDPPSLCRHMPPPTPNGPIPRNASFVDTWSSRKPLLLQIHQSCVDLKTQNPAGCKSTDADNMCSSYLF
jgi:hypothetical protein